MKIVQILTTIVFGDAVSNDTLAIDKILKEKKIETVIYAENIDDRLKGLGIERIIELPKFNKEDIILYHLSTGSELNNELKKTNGHKIIIYHNITPPEYFAKYSENSYKLCNSGLQQTKNLADEVDYVLADSGYNKKCLEGMGFRCKIDILPILIPMKDYEMKPHSEVMEKYVDDGYINILFTGRIAPNKKQEDIVKIFSYYKKYYNQKSRLIIVGSYGGMEKYYNQLLTYVDELGVNDVVFTGHISFDEIIAYYHLADVFLCQSEHEGFCVPLVEAMFFSVPIVAYDSSAIGETLGGSGFLLKEKNALEAAGVIQKIVSSSELKMELIKKQKIRLKDFQYETVKELFWRYLNQYMEKIL